MTSTIQCNERQSLSMGASRLRMLIVQAQAVLSLYFQVEGNTPASDAVGAVESLLELVEAEAEKHDSALCDYLRESKE